MGLFFGLVLSVITLSFFRDFLNRYIYHYLLFVVRNNRVATLIFALLFLPGVALHEISHWIMAKILFVETHRFSLIPEWLEEGTLRFGFVEMSKTDRFRSALIALAPLFSGVVVVLWIGFTHLNLDVVLAGIEGLDWDLVWEGLEIFMRTPDVLLWIYLLLAISNTMLPSPSDYKAWLPAGIILGVIYATVVILSIGSETNSWLVGLANTFAETLLRAFGVAAVVNLCLVVPLWLGDRLIRRIRG
jgi:hypothetical protein